MPRKPTTFEPKILVAVLVFCLLASGCVFNPARTQLISATDRMQELSDSKTSLHWLVAHRGGRSQFADNSVAALKLGAQKGAPMLEFDLRKSSDGVLFLFHDKRLSATEIRDPGELEGRQFSSLSAAEIRSLRRNDADRSKIAELREALQALRSVSAIILPELKDYDSAGLILFTKIITEEGFERRTILQGNSRVLVAEVTANNRNNPAAKLALLIRISSANQLQEALALKPRIIQFDESILKSELILKIQQAGVRSLIKTLDWLGDTTQHHQKLFAAGVDLVLTDYIELDPPG